MANFDQGLFFGNIPTKNKKIKTKLPNFLKSRYLNNITDPFFVFTGTGSIPKLGLTEKEIKKLKKYENIIFCLDEPLSFYIDKFNRGYYSEFPASTDLSMIRAAELDSLEHFSKKYNLNFTVYTCDLNIQLISNNYPLLSLKCFDLFVRRLKPIGFSKTSSFTKRFWCGNWRYTLHRHLIMSYICDYDGVYSWNFSCPMSLIENDPCINFKELEISEPAYFKKIKAGCNILENKKFSIDTDEIPQIKINNTNEFAVPYDIPQKSNILKNSCLEAFCCIVNETRFFQPFGNFSEKTFRAIEARRPFILVAPPHTLGYLKTFGFKTFDKWWNEEYDHEENHQERLIKIFKIIDQIQNTSFEELKIMYLEMQEILEHNYAVLSTVPNNVTHF
jgi:hypothetical protein